jgi:HAD superfamily hydrolase (TIGR01549 family)
MAIKTILFDLGNVLIHSSHERMYRQMAEVCRCEPELILEVLSPLGLQAEFETGRLTEEEFHQRIERHFNREIPFESLRRAGSDIFWPNTDIVPLVARLKQDGYRLVVLSNTCVSHINFVRDRFEVLDHIDDFVLSHEVGAVKPNPAIFAAALQAAGCQPHECFFTDDLEPNVEAGSQFGFVSHVYTDVPTLVQTLKRHGVEVDAEV